MKPTPESVLQGNLIVSVFLDSNILLYGFSTALDHQGKRQCAERLLAKRDWCLSAQVLQEFYVNAIKPQHGLARAVAAAVIEEIALSRQVCPVDTALVFRAIESQERFQLSYWDSVIVAAAMRLGCSTLFTEDLNHGQHFGSLQTINPFIG
jgi:predicted nucleic acid-binding protein